MSRLVTTVLLVDNVPSPGVAEGIRRALSSPEGVLSASFNVSSGLATILHDPEVASAEGLIASLELLGCTARPPGTEVCCGPAGAADSLSRDRRLFVLGAVCSLAVIGVGFVPGLRGDFAGVLQLVLTAPVVILVAGPALFGVRRGAEWHEVLSSAAGAIVFVTAVAVMLSGSGTPCFDAASVMLTVALLGRYVEGVCCQRARGAIDALGEVVPACGFVAASEGVREVMWEEIRPGQELVVRPSEIVPADGVVVSGASSVDEGMLFGPPGTVDKSTGGQVFAGSRNGRGSLTIRAEATGSNTILARKMAEVSGALAETPQIERFSRRVQGLFCFCAVVAAGATVAGWAVFGDRLFPEVGVSPWMISIAAATIFAASAPAGVAAAGRASLAAAVSRAAADGMVVRSMDAFEAGASLGTVSFNKTATVTEGDPQVVETVTIAQGTEIELLGVAAGIERESTHPLARAVTAAAASRGLAIEKPRNFVESAGQGAMGDLSDGKVYVGTSHFLESKGIDLRGLPAEAAKLERRGLSVFFVGKGSGAMGLIAVADPVRDDVAAAVEALKAQGLRVALLSGDNFRTTFAVAERLGFPNVFAALNPEEKAGEVRAMGARGQAVAFVGSGGDTISIMDRAALGIAVGGECWDFGASAQVLVPSGSLLAVPRFVSLARRAIRTVQVNMFVGLFVSSAALVLSALLGVLAAGPGPYVTLLPIGGACVAACGRAFSSIRGLAVGDGEVGREGAG